MPAGLCASGVRRIQGRYRLPAGAISRDKPGDDGMTIQDLSEGDMRVARGVLALPLGSAGDIAAAQRRTVSGVHARLRQLRDAGVVESVSLGCLFPAVERVRLTDEFLSEMKLAGATWHQPGTLVRLLERLTAVETLYPAAAAIRGLGALLEFQWVDGVNFDACVRYEEGWGIFFEVSMLRSEAGFAERLEALGNDLEDLADTDPFPRPSLVCCVVPDRWQLELVQRVVRRYGMEDWVRVWCVADDTWHGAEGFLPGRGWVHQPVYLRSMGREAWRRRVGESLWAAGDSRDAAGLLGRVMPAVRSSPVGEDAVRALRRSVRTVEGSRDAAGKLRRVSAKFLDEGGNAGPAAGIVRRLAASLESPEASQDAARVLYRVAEFPGMTTSMVQLALGEGPTGRRAQNVCRRLTDMGLLVRWRDGREYRYRVSRDGMRLLATMGRVSADSVWTRIQMDRWDNIDGFELHEYGLLDLMFGFVAAGCPVAAGWRDWEPMGWGGGIDPDGLVYLERGSLGSRVALRGVRAQRKEPFLHCEEAPWLRLR